MESKILRDATSPIGNLLLASLILLFLAGPALAQSNTAEQYNFAGSVQIASGLGTNWAIQTRVGNSKLAATLKESIGEAVNNLFQVQLEEALVPLDGENPSRQSPEGSGAYISTQAQEGSSYFPISFQSAPLQLPSNGHP
ncbi:MAG TPA: hypothetical protein ACFYD3_06415 [Candidatus Hypogeohydataceae bacterium YC41]